ncbi:hypothetical protein JVT61DRAFT_14216 [Boletus reticuloceps]|uniref:DUF6532 domain-containing protein n=1 Tax=Boletus reticuloceps TaxID=495285 RepID=A0A8I2YD26_9AGAM|nr:hypothetical protein JVT61DRAFT_14216 [Boletus reticuloceps]
MLDISGNTSSAPSEDMRVVANPKKRNKGKNKDPTLVQFYPRICAAMIDLTKHYFRCHQVFSDLFPSKEASIDGICRDVLYDVMGEFQKMGRMIEEGYWENHKDNMAVCVWKDINTFRSEVRKVVLGIVPIEYKLSAPNARTSAERLATIKDKAAVLSYKFAFLQGPRDKFGRASNFAHNCLRVACQKIFYRKGSKTFRNHNLFREAVPCMAVLYIASYIKGVLDAYKTNGTVDDKVPPSKNEEDFWRMHVKMDQVLADTYHGPKLTSMLKSWA